MMLTLKRDPAFFTHDTCRTSKLSAAAAEYQRIGIKVGRRNLIGQRRQIEAEIRKLTKQYDAATNVYTIKALIDFPCMKCGKTLSTSESIGQLDIKSVVGELNCQNCGVPLQVVQSEHEQEELNAGLDRLSLTAVLACRNPACQRQQFAFNALNVRMQQLSENFVTQQRAVNISTIADVDDVFAMIQILIHQDDPHKFRASFEKLSEYIGRIDENLLKEIEKQSYPELGSREKLSRAKQYLQDVLKNGIGGALGQTAGSFLYELIKRSASQ
jgi:transcription elongation factor Elf1